jgi:hypothetical protein
MLRRDYTGQQMAMSRKEIDIAYYAIDLMHVMEADDFSENEIYQSLYNFVGGSMFASLLAIAKNQGHVSNDTFLKKSSSCPVICIRHRVG